LSVTLARANAIPQLYGGLSWLGIEPSATDVRRLVRLFTRGTGAAAGDGAGDGDVSGETVSRAQFVGRFEACAAELGSSTAKGGAGASAGTSALTPAAWEALAADARANIRPIPLSQAGGGQKERAEAALAAAQADAQSKGLDPLTAFPKAKRWGLFTFKLLAPPTWTMAEAWSSEGTGAYDEMRLAMPQPAASPSWWGGDAPATAEEAGMLCLGVFACAAGGRALPTGCAALRMPTALAVEDGTDYEARKGTGVFGRKGRVSAGQQRREAAAAVLRRCAPAAIGFREVRAPTSCQHAPTAPCSLSRCHHSCHHSCRHCSCAYC
jgi:hypothetical protein